MNKIETQSEEIDEKRFRHFMILLYKDTESYIYDDVLFDLKGSFKNYAYIDHQPEEEEKKEHTHFILSLDNPRTIKSISSRIGVPSNFIQSIKSLRASCRYLVHADNEEKNQYDLADVKVSRSFMKKFLASFDDMKSEQDIIDDIYNFINGESELKRNDRIRDLVKFVNEEGYETIYKRYRPEFMDYLNSFHN